MYRLQALMLCLCALIVGTLQAQDPYGKPTYQNTQVWDTYTANAAQISAASLSWTHYERLGYTAGSLQFAFQITGTPSTLSAKVQPCMRNPTDQPTGGTCPAAAAVTSTATSSFVLSLSGPWDYYVVTVTWTGGGITAITNKVTGIGGSAKNGTGGGATFPATPGVVCNTSTTASANCTSPNLVTALNASPSSTLSPSLLPTSIFANVSLRMFGQCSGGTGFTAAYATPATAAPAPGCVDATGNPVGYLSYLAAQPAAQFTTDTFIAPANFLGADIYFTFYSSATTGNVALTVASGCLALGASPSTITYGTPQTVTTNVSGTPSVLITTAALTNIAQNGVNGCSANSQVIYKVSRSITDTASAPALLVNGVLTVRRSS